MYRTGQHFILTLYAVLSTELLNHCYTPETNIVS